MITKYIVIPSSPDKSDSNNDDGDNGGNGNRGDNSLIHSSNYNQDGQQTRGMLYF